MTENLPQATGYPAILAAIKARIQSGRVRAVLAANREMLRLYYSIGLDLRHRLETGTWGSGIVDQLSRDLAQAFPDMSGFSPGNLRRMRRLVDAYPLKDKDLEIWSRLVAKSEPSGEMYPIPADLPDLPWGHLIDLIAKVTDHPIRAWYAGAAIEHGWSRDVLGLQIASRLHEREGKAITNFARTLPAPQSDLAQAATRDPFTFDFLTLTARANEREVEDKLVAHVAQFLLALGKGFAFVGRQVRLEVGEREYFLDLLFYHLHLRCFVVIELKNGSFQPEYTGKLNFYLSAVDEQMKRPGDHPTIGLILCRSKDRLTAEYALRGMSQPIGIADWQAALTERLPDDLKGSLPTPAELESELGTEESDS